MLDARRWIPDSAQFGVWEVRRQASANDRSWLWAKACSGWYQGTALQGSLAASNADWMLFLYLRGSLFRDNQCDGLEARPKLGCLFPKRKIPRGTQSRSNFNSGMLTAVLNPTSRN
jgi:hypothetical protein